MAQERAQVSAQGPRSSTILLADGNGPGRLWGGDQELKLQSNFPATEFNSVPPVVDPVQVNASVWRMTVELLQRHLHDLLSVGSERWDREQMGRAASDPHIGATTASSWQPRASSSRR